MAERGEESSDSLSPSSVDSCENVENPSPSSSSEESANEDEPDASSISRPSGSKRKENDSQPRSKSYRKQQQKKNKKQNFSLNDEEIEKLSFWIFSTQEVAQVEAENRPQAVSEREQSTKHMPSEARLGLSSLDFVASFQHWRVTALSYQISKIGKLYS